MANRAILKRVLLATLLASLGATVADAQLYHWRDEHGQVHMTDDPARIPERYRAATRSGSVPRTLTTALWAKTVKIRGTNSAVQWQRQREFPSELDCTEARRNALDQADVNFSGRGGYMKRDGGYDATIREGSGIEIREEYRLYCHAGNYDPR
jgi:hypothetical protein